MSRGSTIDYDQVAPNYARHRKIHPQVFDALLANGGLDADSLDGESKVLEVGCGTGNYTQAIAAAAGCSC